MHFNIKTRIEKNDQIIFSKFDINLFRALKPPFINLNILRFDGCKRGDQIHLKMTFLGRFDQSWHGLITEHVISDKGIYFIDEGTLLPFPLKKWKHIHRIEKINKLASYIIDDIDYTSGFKSLDIILLPILYLMFLYRSPVYKRYFSILEV